MQYRLCQKVPTEDRIQLATDVYLPDGPGPFPTILVRTPYHRVGQFGGAGAFVSRGYALVAQDCRGKYDSEGDYVPLAYEADDGKETLDWIANQRWCNGRIGMWGRSYLGIVQVPAASCGHEALKCIVPSVAPGSFFVDWLRYDGCFALANAVRWSLTSATCRNRPPFDHIDWPALWRLNTPEAIAETAGFETPVLRNWASHDVYDSYWAAVDQVPMHEHVRVPGLHVGGWFDHLTRGQFEAYAGIRDRGASDDARQGQRLLIGPWGHQTVGNTGPGHSQYGNWDFGTEADLRVMAHEFQCLDHYLKDLDNGFSTQQPVKLFLMGQNRWISLSDWPAPEAEERVLYLGSDGSANMRTGDGGLSTTEPGDAREDSYVHDPADPVPTLGGPIYWGIEPKGPVDQRPNLQRTDVLYYRGERLGSATAVVGEPEITLYVASDAVDTDFIARLCVEEASGAVTCLTLGSARCRYRDSWAAPKELVKGEVTPIRIRLTQTGYVFPEGSRIGLMVSSSDFPRIESHTNTMAPPLSGAAGQPATNSVHHGPGALSSLRLPILDV
ncbi:MAG: CocE/NonD family hydrolase [Candidatus Latescibacteria bacterium]|jgi:hypothetical protein|nr:CocE/NonD family hydrolase [Candidatus Latescibacterota bacterium]